LKALNGSALLLHRSDPNDDFRVLPHKHTHTHTHTLSHTHTSTTAATSFNSGGGGREGGGEMRDKDRDTRHELMDILDMSQVRVCCSMLHCVLQCVAVCVAVCRSVLHYVREIQIPGIS